MVHMSELAERGYAPTHKLVSTDWVADRLNDPQIRLVESNEDPLLYPSGHLSGAVEVDWTRDLNDALTRDYLDKDRFEKLLERIGVGPETTVVFYGDRNNWWAAYALWVFSLFGFENTKLMDGGRLKWQKEGREFVTTAASAPKGGLTVNDRDDQTLRAFRDDVMAHLRVQGKLIDVRSPQEFSGERTHMEGFPNEGALRGGHIPGARNVPWAKAVNPETGEFLPADELRRLYEQEAGLKPEDDVIVYCRIGERSSHTWFVLKHLLGYEKVRNYDGSWTEWGNLVGAPIER